ncbi:hypothetical protein [Solibacillus isronensis]|uniref:hypothetical protein n=1 Tax=Solibacillus isronensis TaxID=412383 RepID=UPI00335CF28C
MKKLPFDIHLAVPIAAEKFKKSAGNGVLNIVWTKRYRNIESENINVKTITKSTEKV